MVGRKSVDASCGGAPIAKRRSHAVDDRRDAVFPQQFRERAMGQRSPCHGWKVRLIIGLERTHLVGWHSYLLFSGAQRSARRPHLETMQQQFPPACQAFLGRCPDSARERASSKSDFFVDAMYCSYIATVRSFKGDCTARAGEWATTPLWLRGHSHGSDPVWRGVQLPSNSVARPPAPMRLEPGGIEPPAMDVSGEGISS